MKKLLFIIITILCFLLSFFCIVTNILSTPTFITEFETSLITSKKIDSLTNETDYYSTIEETAKKDGLVVARTIYDVFQDEVSTKTTIYTTCVNSDDMSHTIKLKSGHFFDENTSNDEFLSSIDTHDPNQIGIIENFNGANTLELRPFKAQPNQGLPIEFTCYINSMSQDVAKDFEQSLNNAGIETKGISGSSPSLALNTMLIYIAQLGLAVFACIMMLFIITLLYYLITNYKKFAISKLFGATNLSIFKNILTTIGKMFMISEFLNFVITTIVLGVFNSFAFYTRFILMWLLLQYLFFMLLFLVTLLSLSLIKRIKVSEMIKNKKPLKLSQFINTIVKIIFASVSVVIFCLSFNNITYLIKNNPNIERWEQTKQLANVHVINTSVLGSGRIINEQRYHEVGNKILDFIHLCNEKGGILMSPSNYYDDMLSNQNQSSPDYSPGKKSVKINTNYLNNNPIEASTGELVTVNNADNTITLLVPEKYKSNEPEIVSLYEQALTFSHYTYDDSLARALKNTYSYNDPIHHDPVPIQLLYVKNNQKYFTYNPVYCKENNNEIIDPIAIVYNNNTFHLDLCFNDIAKGNYFATVTDMHHIQESLISDVIHTKTESNLFFQSVYRQVDEQLNKIKVEMLLQVTIMVVSIIVLIMILFTLIFNYLEQHKRINAVKQMHGYSFIKRHSKYYEILTITWTAIFIGITLLNIIASLSLPASHIGIASLGLLIFEIILSTLMIKLKELINTKDILKGE